MLDKKYRIDPAFTFDGIDYYYFPSQEEVPTGRAFAALAVYNEMDMRVSRESLELYCKAVEKILSDPKKINIGLLAQLNYNLRDATGLMVIPDFIYKLASVVFFDLSESLYSYDYEYNEKKIAKWKTNPRALDFFFQTPLMTLVPFLNAQKDVSSTFSLMAEQVSNIHRKLTTDVLSGDL